MRLWLAVIASTAAYRNNQFSDVMRDHGQRWSWSSQSFKPFPIDLQQKNESICVSTSKCRSSCRVKTTVNLFVITVKHINGWHFMFFPSGCNSTFHRDVGFSHIWLQTHTFCVFVAHSGCILCVPSVTWLIHHLIKDQKQIKADVCVSSVSSWMSSCHSDL